MQQEGMAEPAASDLRGVGDSMDRPLTLLRRIGAWGARVGLERKLALSLLAASLMSGLATYGAITGVIVSPPDPRLILLLLLLDLILLLLLVVVVARRLVVLWLERRRGLAGARLHTRLVLWFSLGAVTPTIIVAIFSALFLNIGMAGWFSTEVRTAIRDSLFVAQAYLQEHQQQLGTDVVGLAEDLRRESLFLNGSREEFEQELGVQSTLRGLDEAVVLNSDREVVARAGYSLLMEFDAPPPDWAMARARDGEVAILPSDTGDRVRALVRLDPFADSYLFVGRLIDPRVLAHLDKSRGAALTYEKLEGRRSGLQITFALIFVVIALLVLFAAVWLAIVLGTQLVRPITSLAGAAERVGAGDLAARVAEGAGDELGTLSSAFNRMTSQLASQQAALVAANAELDERRRFTELVLSGVSAGVIGLDYEARVTLPNRSASELLGIDLSQSVGEPLAAIVPELAELLAAAGQRAPRGTEGQVDLVRGAETRTLLVRVAAEEEPSGLVGFVVTFDDVTELLSAQRKAAWADVARRIAHEIKNPLTPIQLSAERLKRKYLKEIHSDPETFTACTDTIVRQVGDIGRMVDEFSSFARMPAPVKRPEDLVPICRQALFLQQSAHLQIEYRSHFPEEPTVLACDGRQVGQALTNLLQNAADSIEARRAEGRDEPGRIELFVEVEHLRVIVTVEDNGRGLPAHQRERLTEPYVTTRAKGTGLGLAIVKKIMEDHDGNLVLDDRSGGGAAVRLVFHLTAPLTMRMGSHGA
jgi:two-component system nitrogen regulation sensor histidine kinase NtrY